MEKLPKITLKQVLEILKKRWWVILIELAVLAFTLLADQFSKIHAVELYEAKGSFEVIPKLITLTYVENTGAGFGMFDGNVQTLNIITLIVMIGIFIYLVIAQKHSMWLRIPLILVLGGGLGNIIDRFMLGYVRDFVQFTFWPTFPVYNVADNFVTIGAFALIIVLVIMLITEGRKNQKEFEKEQAEKLASGEHEVLTDPLDAPINLNPMMKSENDYTFVESDKNIESDKSEDNK